MSVWDQPPPQSPVRLIGTNSLKKQLVSTLLPQLSRCLWNKPPTPASGMLERRSHDRHPVTFNSWTRRLNLASHSCERSRREFTKRCWLVRWLPSRRRSSRAVSETPNSGFFLFLFTREMTSQHWKVTKLDPSVQSNNGSRWRVWGWSVWLTPQNFSPFPVRGNLSSGSRHAH